MSHPIRNRVQRLETIRAADLLDNEGNWRLHPEAQRAALRGVLGEIGQAGALLAYYSDRNGGKLTLIDGHARKSEDPDLEWPVLITDLNDEEADTLLVVYDPISALAATSREKLDQALRKSSTSDAALQQLMGALADQARMYKGGVHIESGSGGPPLSSPLEHAFHADLSPGSVIGSPPPSFLRADDEDMEDDADIPPRMPQAFEARDLSPLPPPHASIMAPTPEYAVPAPPTPEPRPEVALELQKKWDTYPGQVWEIPSATVPGRSHRLVCDDSTSQNVTNALFEDERAAIVWTDPPWNVAYQGSGDRGRARAAIANDNLGADFPRFLTDVCQRIHAHIVPGGMIYVAMSTQEMGNLDRALRAEGFHWSSTIIWGKNNATFGRKDYHAAYEPIWYGWEGSGPRVHPVPDRKQTDLWMIDRPVRSEEHPTMKPVELVRRSLLNSSHEGALVFDPFLGSGTTMVASEITGRICYGIELYPGYAAVILQRMKDMGLEPVCTYDPPRDEEHPVMPEEGASHEETAEQ